MSRATVAALLRSVRNFCREPYAWPGGYPRVLLFEDGQVSCADCARENYRLISQDTRDSYHGGWVAAGVEIFWEGEREHCACCDCVIEPAYSGDDAA